MAAWFGVGGDMRTTNKTMPTWCGVDEQRWKIQPWQQVWGACADVGDAAMTAWLGVTAHICEIQPCQHGFGWT